MLCNELMNNGEYVPALGHEWTKDAEKSTAETTAYKCTRTGCTATMLQAVATEKYDITVVGGSAYLTAGSTIAKAAEGAVVKLKAEPPKGKALEKWEVTSGGVTLKDAEKADGASFVMPKGAVKITAKFVKADHVHTPTGDWKSDAKTHWHTCKDCTAHADEAKHSFVWKTDKAATETATGLKHEECTVCGYQRSKNTVIDKLGGKTEKPDKPDSKFTDVKEDAYYAEAVEWAVGKGITGGTSKTTFSPDLVCTRAQAVTFLWRAAGSPAPKTETMTFIDAAADRNNVSAYSGKSIREHYENEPVWQICGDLWDDAE